MAFQNNHAPYTIVPVYVQHNVACVDLVSLLMIQTVPINVLGAHTPEQTRVRAHAGVCTYLRMLTHVLQWCVYKYILVNV